MDRCPAHRLTSRAPALVGSRETTGDVDLTSIPQPRDGRGHGQCAAGWRMLREGARSGQMSRGLTFPTHPLGRGAIYGHRRLLPAKSSEGATATGEWGAVLAPSAGTCTQLCLGEVGAGWTCAKSARSGVLPGAPAMAHGAASGSGWG